MREDVGRVVLVEQEDLGVGVPEELGHDQPDQGRLAGSGGPEDQRVAHVAHVEVQPERRRARRGGVEERGAPLRKRGTGVRLQPGPDAGEREQIGQVQGVEERLADVLVAVPGSEPSQASRAFASSIRAPNP